jgi:hypothetical protein
MIRKMKCAFRSNYTLPVHHHYPLSLIFIYVLSLSLSLSSILKLSEEYYIAFEYMVNILHAVGGGDRSSEVNLCKWRKVIHE